MVGVAECEKGCGWAWKEYYSTFTYSHNVFVYFQVKYVGNSLLVQFFCISDII